MKEGNVKGLMEQILFECKQFGLDTSTHMTRDTKDSYH